MFKRTLMVLEPADEPDVLVRASAMLVTSRCGELVLYTALTRADRRALDEPATKAPRETARMPEQAEWLHRQAQQAAGRLGLVCRSLVRQEALSAQCILEAARASRSDAIVLDSSGRNAVARLLTGSVVPRLVTASTLPVMVCPRGWNRPSAASDGHRRLLVVVEGADLGRSPLAQALALARSQSAELQLCHVGLPYTARSTDLKGLAAAATEHFALHAQEESQRVLASALSRARKAGVPARGFCLPAGTTGGNIAHVALDESCDLIIVAHRGDNAVIRLLKGSLIPGLITATTMPLLICRSSHHPTDARAPGRRRHRPRPSAPRAVRALAR